MRHRSDHLTTAVRERHRWFDRSTGEIRCTSECPYHVKKKRVCRLNSHRFGYPTTWRHLTHGHHSLCPRKVFTLPRVVALYQPCCTTQLHVLHRVVKTGCRERFQGRQISAAIRLPVLGGVLLVDRKGYQIVKAVMLISYNAVNFLTLMHVDATLWEWVEVWRN